MTWAWVPFPLDAIAPPIATQLALPYLPETFTPDWSHFSDALRNCVRAVLPLADWHMQSAKRQDAINFTSSGDRTEPDCMFKVSGCHSVCFLQSIKNEFC